MNLSFSEKLILFLISPPPLDKGLVKLSFPSWVDIQLNFYAACGIIIELLADKKIDVTNNQVRVVDKNVTGIEYKDIFLETIGRCVEYKTFDYWINFFSDMNTKVENRFNLYKKVENALIAKEAIFLKQNRYLVVFKTAEISCTSSGCGAINEIVKEIINSTTNAKFEKTTLLLTILLGADFADMLKYYLDKKHQEVLTNLIANPSFKMDYAPIFFTADEITQAFYGRI